MTQNTPRTAYHRHTGRPIGIVRSADRKQVVCIRDGRLFAARRCDVTLSQASAAQIAAWAPRLWMGS